MANTNLYDYAKIFGEIKTKFPTRFEVPEITVYNQFNYGDCTGCASAAAAELIFGKPFSSGWYMCQSKAKNQVGNGRFLVNVLDAMCNIGGVPLAHFGILGERENICESVKDNTELLNIAKRYKMDGYCNLLYANSTKRDNAIKDAISKYANNKKVAVIATSNSYFSENHCILLAGWDDEKNKYIFHNSQGKIYGTNGRGEIPKDKIDAVYAVFKETEEMPFTDLPKDWSYDDIKYIYDEGLVNGKATDKLAPKDYVTREEMFALLGRILRNEHQRSERDVLLNNQGEI